MLYIDQIGNGLVLGTIIAITSVGLSLIYGVTRVINFAHGELVTLGAVIALVLSLPAGSEPAGLGWPFLVAVAAAVVAGGIVAAFLELSLFRPLRRRNVGGITILVVTIGLAFAVRHLILIWITGQPFQYPLAPERQRSFLFVDLTPRDAWIIVMSFAAMTLLGLFLLKTRTGTAMRALADNPDLAESSGIDVDRIILVTWIIGGALAALGGVFQGITETVRWDMGFLLLLLMFAGVILGGIGTAFGAMLGGLLIGMIAQVSTALPILEGKTDLKTAIALGVMILFLLLLPQGLLGKRERIS